MFRRGVWSSSQWTRLASVCKDIRRRGRVKRALECVLYGCYRINKERKSEHYWLGCFFKKIQNKKKKTSPTLGPGKMKEPRTVRWRWPSKDFDDRPAERHIISSNSAFAKCCFRERGAGEVGSDFPPACLWSVFVSRFEATWPTCCDRQGINSASRQNKRKEEKKKKKPQRKKMLKTIKVRFRCGGTLGPSDSHMLESEVWKVGKIRHEAGSLKQPNYPPPPSLHNHHPAVPSQLPIKLLLWCVHLLSRMGVCFLAS